MKAEQSKRRRVLLYALDAAVSICASCIMIAIFPMGIPIVLLAESSPRF